MKLLTKELEKRFAEVGCQEEVPMGEQKVIAVYFHPLSNWTWYATEYLPERKQFFGLVVGFEQEWGYFSLEEMEQVVVRGLPVERDLHFEEVEFKKIAEEIGYTIKEDEDDN